MSQVYLDLTNKQRFFLSKIISDNLNNQLDFYQNQIQPNQNNQANVVMRQDRREVSFEVDQNFLQSSFNRFLDQNFQKIQNIENYKQNIAQLYNIFQIMGQEIIKLKNDLTEAFKIQEQKIKDIDKSKNEVNIKCSNFYEEFQKENEKNLEIKNNENKELNENNNKIASK